MKTFLIFLILFTSSFSQNGEKQKKEYNMKVYFVGIVLKGELWSPDMTTEIEKLHQDHLKYIDELFEEGKLIIAGPFVYKDEKRGILIFNTKTFDEAIELANNDPAVIAGRLKVEMREWMAADGLMLDYEKALIK